jgi:nicotinamide-nucleotide amidase
LSARAGIVITGTEVLTGRIRDRNGPWLADRLLELGVELAHITICGDRPEDIESQLRFLASDGVDLIVTSGGLGPTADDMTVEVVARFAGRPLVMDDALEARIAEILRPLLRRFRHWDPEAARAANRKQALVPEGAFVIDPVGTAPGVVVPGEPPVVVLPGPPRELQPMWAVAAGTDIVREALVGRTSYVQRTARLFGLPESGMAETLREAESEVDGFDRLEITTCLRRGEVEVVTRFEPDGAAAYEGLLDLVARRHPRELFSVDGARVDDQVAGLLSGRRIATAESCTAGLIAARLTERAGSSAYVAGGVVAYANEAKTELLGVDPGLIERHGAVSEEVAEAMAGGALARFGADTAVSVTGIAGPDGGTAEKPVGTVCWSVRLREGRSLTRTLLLPGDRADIRERATTVAFHLLRRLLRGEEDEVP